MDAAHAIAKIGVSTNPNLCPGGTVYELVGPLTLLTRGESELQQFEAALALTNLASMDDDMKDHLVKHGVWRQLEFLCASSNDKVQAAAAGGLCNLVTCPSIIEKIVKQGEEGLTKQGGSSIVRFFCVMCHAENPDTQRACAGALAMLAELASELEVRHFSVLCASNDGSAAIAAADGCAQWHAFAAEAVALCSARRSPSRLSTARESRHCPKCSRAVRA